MIKRTTRLRWRRKYRRGRRQFEDLGVQAEENIEKHFFHRLAKLVSIGRFVAGWITLIVLLSAITVIQTRSLTRHYKTLQPVAGGIFNEGMEGFFTNANPIYATTLADASVSKLVFAGLLKVDDNNKLVADLAESWKLNEQNDTYTVKLKPGLIWHDGRPLTAEDVVYTFKMAQHPDAKSSLFQAWRQVTIQQVDDQTVTFTPKNPLASFVYDLTTGIIPKHKLSHINPAQLRSASFNTTSPVGSGPFSWQAIETTGDKRENTKQQIGLRRFNNYHKGTPKLESFILNIYPDKKSLVEAFKSQEINAMIALEQVPDELSKDKSITTYETPIMAANMVFFQLESDILKDQKVRQALLRGVNIPEFIKSLGYPVVPVEEPILKEHFAHDKKFKQLNYDETKAKALLDEAGWKLPGIGLSREKDKNKLTLRLYGRDTPEISSIGQHLKNSWEKLGVKTEINLQSTEDLQITINSRDYDILIRGVTIGPDPDVFVYWHGSQADARSASRLNFSNYKSGIADAALEASRSRFDPSIRKAKLIPFLQAWHDEVPGFGLYQPRFLIITKGQIFNYQQNRITNPAERFWNVHDWMIRQGLRP